MGQGNDFYRQEIPYDAMGDFSELLKKSNAEREPDRSAEEME